MAIRPLTVISLLALTATLAAQHRLEAPRIGGVEGYHGYSGVSGVGQRRSLPSQYQFRNNEAQGRRFEHSFDLRTNAEFASHNLDNPEEVLRTTSLYNNPWYWQHVGSLQTELMTGGSGIPMASMQADGDYYNPVFYSQWATNDGMRHAGAVTDEFSKPSRFDQSTQPTTSGSGSSRHDGPAVVPGTNEDQLPSTDLSTRVGQLATHRTVLSGDRLGTTLRADIDGTWSGLRDRELGRGLEGGRPVDYLGSDLRGLVMSQSSATAAQRIGISAYDLARRREDSQQGRPLSPSGKPWDTQFRDLTMPAKTVDTRMNVEPAALPISHDMAATYQAMADRYASLHPASMTLEERLSALERDYRLLRGRLIAGPGATLAMSTQLERPATPSTGTTSSGDGEPTTDETGQVPIARQVDVAPSLQWSDFGVLLRHDRHVDTLAAGDGSRFDDLIAAGADKLKAGDYFWAERRFGRALRLVPGHPMATAGLGHAQLGANLYLSSALTLQSLLAFQPEMIDVTYGPDLLPDEEAMDRAIATLSRRIDQGIDLDRYGFLLAYIGHQRGRADLVDAGLAAMEAGQADPAFVEVLREVWGPDATE